MKKWFIGVIIFILLFILSVYFFIPDKLTFSTSVLVKANSNGAYRCLTDSNKWNKLFGAPADKNVFDFNSDRYAINGKTIDGLIVHIQDEDSATKGVIRILPLSTDSCAIVWESTIASGLNPLKKTSRFLHKKEFLQNMNNILGNVKQFLNKEENVYGLHINKETIKDSLLIYQKNVFNDYPDYKSIYDIINKLRNYAAVKGANTTNYPMLNITKSDNAGYVATVAIPIDKEIAGSGNIELKRLILGNILVSEVKGGTATTINAGKMMENYMSDYNYDSPGVPYQSLITNRTTEMDTTKWITKLNYPVY